MFVLAYVQMCAMWYSLKVHPVGSGSDAFLADSRGRFVAEMIRRIEAQGEPGGTLAVLPEGVMINYLTRRPNTAPYLTFLSDSLSFYGSEAPILRAYEAAPPDQILLVHRDSSEYGPQYFGRDYAFGMASWISSNYAAVCQLGALPGQSDRYGMLLLTRRPASSTR